MYLGRCEEDRLCGCNKRNVLPETASLIDASRWRLLQKADRRAALWLWFLSCWELLASEVGQLASASQILRKSVADAKRDTSLWETPGLQRVETVSGNVTVTFG